MSKTVEEITAAHRRTIEVFTGMTCTIILTDKKEAVLKNTPLTEILLCAELHNDGSYAITARSAEPPTVKARKIFCLLASRAGFSSVKIAKFLGRKEHTGVLYLLKTGKHLLTTDDNFKKLYAAILHEIVNRKS